MFNSQDIYESTTTDSDFSFEIGEYVPLASAKTQVKKPKRNKSAFILFSIDARAKLKAEGQLTGEITSNEIMVKLANMWQTASAEERQIYQDRFEEERTKYRKELNEFLQANPDEVIQNKTKRNHIKKPCSAYALFLKERKPIIKNENPELKMADVLKVVAKEWKELDARERVIFEEQAKVEKEKIRIQREELSKKNQESNSNEHQESPMKRVRVIPTEKTSKTDRKKQDKIKQKEYLDWTLEYSSASPKDPEMTLFTFNYNYFPLEERKIVDVAPYYLNQETPALRQQESRVIITTENLFPSKSNEKKNKLNMRNAEKQKITRNESSVDLFDFNRQISRTDSTELMGLSFMRGDSNRFGSTIELNNLSAGNTDVKISREKINNALVDAMESSDDNSIAQLLNLEF